MVFTVGRVAVEFSLSRTGAGKVAWLKPGARVGLGYGPNKEKDKEKLSKLKRPWLAPQSHAIFFFLTEVPQGMDLISRRKGIAPILLGSREKNIEKEGGPKGRIFYYCTLHFTMWRSYKPLLSLLQVFELICHIRETVFCTIRTTRISDKEIVFCVLVISFFQKLQQREYTSRLSYWH